MRGREGGRTCGCGRPLGRSAEGGEKVSCFGEQLLLKGTYPGLPSHRPLSACRSEPLCPTRSCGWRRYLKWATPLRTLAHPAARSAIPGWQGDVILLNPHLPHTLPISRS